MNTFFIKTLLCLILMTTLSCSELEKKVLFDNPTDTKLIITRNNGSDIHISPNQSRNVKVRFGDNQMIVNGKDTLNFYLDSEYDYLINPALETYYVQNIYFINSIRGQKQYTKDIGKLKSTVEGFDIEGDFKKIEGKVTIKKNWTFGLDEKPSRIGRVKANNRKGYISFRKIHRKKDLMKNYQVQLKEHLENELKKVQ